MKRAAISVVAAVGMGALTSTASAAVEINAKRIVVETEAGRAVVDRAPFRLTFENARGEVLLREVGARRRDPVDLPLTDDPEPFAVERKPDNATYAPLSFEVGRENLEQWNALFGTATRCSRAARARCTSPTR